MLAAGIGPIGPFEAIIILLVVVLIFGVSKVGDLGGALGKSVREFRKAAKDDDDEKPAAAQVAASTASASGTGPAENASTEGPFCDNCGAQLNPESKFCAKCGAPVNATVS